MDETNGTREQARVDRATLTAEMTRTAFQRKAVSHLPPNEALEDAIAFFKARGYRAGRTGRPNQIYIMGGREGILPRVTAEILAQGNVGKAKTTMLTISGFGEHLRNHLQAYTEHVREQRRLARQRDAG
ncbi:hypothetical protein [Sphaerobacter thermophilus]|jgi:hypothetical protein|uniref:hypothetical protein n=1 Tax=Sphaerobacter thermophilus TaxID=2057 RepID=UPI0039C0EB75